MDGPVPQSLAPEELGWGSHCTILFHNSDFAASYPSPDTPKAGGARPAQPQFAPGASPTSKSLSSLSSASTNSLLSTSCREQRQGLSTAVPQLVQEPPQGFSELSRVVLSQQAGAPQGSTRAGLKALPHHHHLLLPSLHPTRSRSLHLAAGGPCQRRGWGSCKCLRTERKIGIFREPQGEDGLWAGGALKARTGQHQTEVNVWISPVPILTPHSCTEQEGSPRVLGLPVFRGARHPLSPCVPARGSSAGAAL